MKQKQMQLVALAAFLLAAGGAFATSIVDYATIMTSVTGELTAGVTVAAAGIGILWGARIGTRFVKGLLH